MNKKQGKEPTEKQPLKITAIVITRNEEEMLGKCLDSLSFCDEIIVVDSNSTDSTVRIAKEKGAHVYEDESRDFSAKRNTGAEKATGDHKILFSYILLLLQLPESRIGNK